VGDDDVALTDHALYVDAQLGELPSEAGDEADERIGTVGSTAVHALHRSCRPGAPHSAPRARAIKAESTPAIIGSEVLLGEHPDTSAAALDSSCHALISR
jgi:hypothetical protein